MNKNNSPLLEISGAWGASVQDQKHEDLADPDPIWVKPRSDLYLSSAVLCALYHPLQCKTTLIKHKLCRNLTIKQEKHYFQLIAENLKGNTIKYIIFFNHLS